MVLKTKKGIIKTIRTINWFKLGRFLDKLSEEQHNDREIAVEILKRNPSRLRYMDDTIKDDKELVIIALKSHFSDMKVFLNVSDRLKNDKDVVNAALANNYYSFQDVGEELKNDEAFIFEVLDKYPNLYSYVNPKFRENKELTLKFFVANEEIDPKYIPSVLLDDIDVMNTLIPNHPTAIILGNMKFIHDKEILQKALLRAYKTNEAVRIYGNLPIEIASDQELIDFIYINMPIFAQNNERFKSIIKHNEYNSSKSKDTEMAYIRKELEEIKQKLSQIESGISRTNK